MSEDLTKRDDVNWSIGLLLKSIGRVHTISVSRMQFALLY